MEQAVILHLPFREEGLNPSDEHEAAFALAEELEDAINFAAAGEYDGEEFGGGRCTFYMYGPEADRLFEAIEPILKKNLIATGGVVIKRYGEATDTNATEVRIHL